MLLLLLCTCEIHLREEKILFHQIYARKRQETSVFANKLKESALQPYGRLTWKVMMAKKIIYTRIKLKLSLKLFYISEYF
jgi:hypothetical protein